MNENSVDTIWTLEIVAYKLAANECYYYYYYYYYYLFYHSPCWCSFCASAGRKQCT